jgi:SAM-dependent methyltransferase
VTDTYDSRARTYDRLVRSRVYNRLAWGTAPADYERFAAEALGDAAGPLLDACAGTAAATAGLYRQSRRPIVLADRSRAMLDVAQARIDRPGVGYVACDLSEPPFEARSFGTVACFGFLHIAEDPAGWVGCLRALTSGRLFLSALVADRRASRAYLRALHRAGEVARPRRAAELERLVNEGAGGASVDFRVRGAMAYAVLGA